MLRRQGVEHDWLARMGAVVRPAEEGDALALFYGMAFGFALEFVAALVVIGAWYFLYLESPK